MSFIDDFSRDRVLNMVTSVLKVTPGFEYDHWYYDKIHGIQHSLQCMYYTDLILNHVSSLGLQELNLEESEYASDKLLYHTMLIAAATHDIGLFQTKYSNERKTHHIYGSKFFDQMALMLYNSVIYMTGYTSNEDDFLRFKSFIKQAIRNHRVYHTGIRSLKDLPTYSDIISVADKLCYYTKFEIFQRTMLFTDDEKAVTEDGIHDGIEHICEKVIGKIYPNELLKDAAKACGIKECDLLNTTDPQEIKRQYLQYCREMGIRVYANKEDMGEDIHNLNEGKCVYTKHFEFNWTLNK